MARLVSGYYIPQYGKLPELKLALRYDENTRKVVTLTSPVRPRFYVPRELLGGSINIIHNHCQSPAIKTGANWKFAHPTHRDKTPVQVEVWNPKNVGVIRDEIFRKFTKDKVKPLVGEGDIPFIRNLLRILNVTKCIDVVAGDIVESDSMPLPKILFIDIEASDLHGFAQANRDPIFSIQTCTKDGFVKVFSWHPSDPTTSEKQMVFDFLNYVIDFDHLIGWCINFDRRYLINRVRNLGFSFEWRLFRFVDIERLYRGMHKLPWIVSLAYAVKREKYEERKGYTIKKIRKYHELWLNDYDTFLERVTKHVVALKDLEEDCMLYESRLKLSDLANMFVDRALFPSTVVRNMLLNDPHSGGNEWIFGCKDYDRGRGKKTPGYEGAYVIEPLHDFYNNVALLDFLSLYNKIIQTWNIGFDTLDPNGKIRAHNNNYTTDFQSLPSKKLQWLEGLRDEYKDLRKKAAKDGDEIKYEAYDAAQYAVKVILLVFYGVTGDKRSDIYIPSLAEDISMMGQACLRYTKKQTEILGYTVAYGDSVTGDSPIIIRKDGNISITTMEDLYNSLKYNGQFLMGGCKTRITPNILVETLSIDNLGHSVWEKIEQIMRHKTLKKIFKVITKYGFVKVTEDHSLIEYKNKQFSKVSPTSIDGDIELVHINNIPKYIGRDRVDLTNYLKRDCYIIDDDRIYKKVKLRSGEVVKSKIWFRRVWDDEDLLQLCWFLGFFCADGSNTKVSTKRKLSAIYNQNKEYMKIASLFQELSTGRKTKIITGIAASGNISYKINFSSMVEYNIFSELCGIGAKHKKIPEFVFNLMKKFQKEYIDGFNAGDGSKNPGGSVYSLWSSSYILSSGLHFILRRLGFLSTVGYSKKRDHFRTRAQTGKRFVNARILADTILCPKKEVLPDNRGEGYVYDLSVGGSHIFTAGIGMPALHNTDSCIIKFSNSDDDFEETLDKSQRFVTYLNDLYYNEFLPKYNIPKEWRHVEMKLEELMYSILFTAKKRYAYLRTWDVDHGFLDKPKLKVKGMETVRHEWCELSKIMLEKALNLRLYRAPQKEMFSYIKDVKDRFFAGEFDHLLMLSTGLGKRIEDYDAPGPHVRAAKKLRDMGYQVRKHDKIDYVITGFNRNKAVVEPVIDKLPELSERAYQHYWDRKIFPPVERIIEGSMRPWQFATLKSVKRKKDLSSLFG